MVPNFKYLGSVISSHDTVDSEIIIRIQSACTAFGKHEKQLWKRNGVRLATKCKIYIIQTSSHPSTTLQGRNLYAIPETHPKTGSNSTETHKTDIGNTMK